MAPPSPAAEQRRLLLRMVLYTALLHGAMIAIYNLAGVDGASATVRGAFTVAWVAATFVLVSIYLRRMRLARRGLSVRGRK